VNRLYIALAGIVAFALASAYLLPTLLPPPAPTSPKEIERVVEVAGLEALSAQPPSPDLEIKVTEGVKHLVPLDKIVSGGPPPDGIPSIDEPVFVGVEEAQEFLSDGEWVFGLHFNGVAKAYPAKILVWHEIVNDWFGEIPVVITYCPLCFSSLAFIRVIDGEPVEFGTSGKLYNSDLVMYDRKTRTYWSQMLGQGIKGELTGYTLLVLPLDMMRWADWRSLYPNTLVLSPDTGYARPYGVDPYQGYYTSPRIFFPVDNWDDRLPPKMLIYGLRLNGEAKAYPHYRAAEVGVVNDVVGGEQVVIFSPKQGMIRAFSRVVDGQVLTFRLEGDGFIDEETRTRWSFDGVALEGALEGRQLRRLPGHTAFWFAWVAFYPDTAVYGE
jgi:hypothetical protein